MNPPASFKGTGVALVTPFRNQAIDWEAYETILEHIITGGVDFLVSLGTTGESATTSESEHRQILDFTIRVNKGRLPIVAGVFGYNNTAALVEKVQHFNFEGIDAILSSSPSYNKPTQEGIFRHYMALAEASPRPIILYNVPSRTARNMTADTTLRLAHASDKFIGIKEASDDLFQITRILRDRPEGFLLLSGDDAMTMPILTMGGDGVICVVGNVLPKHFSQMVREGLQGDWQKAYLLNNKMLDFYKMLFAEGSPAGIKAALESRGFGTREVRLPLVPMSDSGAEQLRQELDRILA